MRKFLKTIIDWFDLCDHDIKIYKVQYLDFSPRKINGLKYDIYRYTEYSHCTLCGKEYVNIRSIETTKYYTIDSFNLYLQSALSKFNNLL